jgi:hypothetical protein
MDRWELYTAGKISKPTRSPGLLRLEAHGDFVIEWPDNHPPENNELRELPGSIFALDSATAEDTLRDRCFGLDRTASQAVNRRREKLWHESCRPGKPPLVTLQAAAGGFALWMVASVALVVYLAVTGVWT